MTLGHELRALNGKKKTLNAKLKEQKTTLNASNVALNVKL